MFWLKLIKILKQWKFTLIRAPMLEACFTAATAASPSPMTNTLAGGMLPEDVIWPDNDRPNKWEASVIALK